MQKHRPIVRLLVPLLVTFAILLVGCGDSNSGATEPSGDTSDVAQDSVAPADVSVVDDTSVDTAMEDVVPDGEDVTLGDAPLEVSVDVDEEDVSEVTTADALPQDASVPKDTASDATSDVAPTDVGQPGCAMDEDCLSQDVCTEGTCLGTGDCLFKPINDCCESVADCPTPTTPCAITTCEANVCKIDASGCATPVALVSAWAGSGEQGYVDGYVQLAQFAQPRGLSIHDGTLVVVDDMSDTIRAIDLETEMVSTLAGGSNTTQGDWNVTTTPWLFGGYLDGPVEDALFDIPIDAIHEPDTGAVIISDCFNHTIRRIADGQVTTIAGNGVSGLGLGPAIDALLNCPCGMEFGEDGALYFADSGNHRIVRLIDGAIELVAGTGEEGFTEGPAETAQLSQPTMLLFLEDGSLLFSDSGNHVIRMLKDGAVTTWAGSGVEGTVDGPNLEAQFDYPFDLVMHPLGGLIVTDLEAHVLRWIAGGQASTLSGTGEKAVLGGWGEEAKHSSPHSLAVDDAGLIYVTEFQGYAVRTISLTTP